MRRTVRVLLLVVALGGLTFLFVLPGRTWLQQRSAMSAAEHRLEMLTRENAALSRRAAQLQDAAYVKQIAREQYGLVMPGEQAYGILLPTGPASTQAPVPATTTTTTTVPAP